MSQTIWTRCGARSSCRRLSGQAWRVVEAQHVVSTRKLVDNLDEQAILEDLIEGAKPPLPGGSKLHWLLSTPFRYPPLRHGSRFGDTLHRGIWYGSDAVACGLAEVAYYRLVFLEGTAADLRLETEMTVFAASYATRAGVDLTRKPFDAFAKSLFSPTDYRSSQALGTAMREDGVQVFRYRSARDPDGGTNIGIFDAAAFASPRPTRLETWLCYASRTGVDFIRKNLAVTLTTLSFPRATFEVKGVLPQPAL